MAIRIYVDEAAKLESPIPYEEWMDKAECLDEPIEKFFPPKGGRMDEARELCNWCEVRIKCLAWILTTEDPYKREGMAGGMSPSERTKLQKRLDEQREQNNDHHA